MPANPQPEQKKVMITQHSITILWGATPELDGRRPQTYQFDTEIELNAFIKGVEEASGWLEYEIIDEDDPDDENEGED
jgi:hypothetical protein